MSEKPRRFIAGAVCPRCGAMDRLVVFSRDGRDYRACVSCDFEEVMSLRAPVRELKTRVNKNSHPQAEPQPVKLIDPED